MSKILFWAIVRSIILTGSAYAIAVAVGTWTSPGLGVATMFCLLIAGVWLVRSGYLPIGGDL